MSVTTPEKKIVELPVKDYPDGYMTTFTPTEAGTHTVEVLYDKKPVDKSPFTVMAEPVTPEPKKPVPQFDVKGLEKGKLFCKCLLSSLIQVSPASWYI